MYHKGRSHEHQNDAFTIPSVSMPNNKRKERDDFDLKRLNLPFTKLPMPAVALAGSDKAAHSVLSNQLLAGYLAHEFLTRGTLFGQMWDPARSQLTVAESRRGIGEDVDPNERSRAGEAEPKEEKHQRYVEVASLLKTGRAHIRASSTRANSLVSYRCKAVFSHVETPH